MIRYLAIDYESEYANDARALTSRYKLPLIATPKSDNKKCLNYRKPWTKATKNQGFDESLQKVEFPTNLRTSPLVEIYEKNFLLEGSEYGFQTLETNPLQSIGIEDIFPSKKLKDGRPSIDKLLRKHSAVVLSDPYHEIQNKGFVEETLNLNFPCDEKKVNLTNLLCSDIRPLKCDVDKLMVDGNFIQTQVLPSLSKNFPQEELILEDLGEKDDMGSCVSSIKELCQDSNIIEKFEHQTFIEQSDIELMNEDEECDIITFESPLMLPSIKFSTSSNTEEIFDFIQMNIQDSSLDELLRYSASHSEIYHEGFDPIQCSRLIIPDPKVLKSAMKQLQCMEILKAQNLVNTLDDISTEESKTLEAELQLLKTDFETFETFTNINDSTMRDVGTGDCSEVFYPLTKESEDIVEAVSIYKDPTHIGIQNYEAGKVNLKLDASAASEHHLLDAQDETFTMLPPLTLDAHLLEKLKHHVPSECVQIDAYINQRRSSSLSNKSDSTTSSKENNTIDKKSFPKDHGLKNGPPDQTSSGLLDFTQIRYRLVQIPITGVMVSILRNLQALLEPAMKLLRRSQVIGNNVTFETLDEDFLKYHLRNVKKELQDSRVAVPKQSIEVTSVVVYCFVVCRDKLITLSLQSACGFLNDFYKKQQMLKTVSSINGNEDFSFLTTVIPDAISILEKANHEDFQHPKILETLRILHERFSKDLRRAIPSTVLFVVRNSCSHLLEELVNAVEELNSLEFAGMLKVSVLPNCEDQRQRLAAFEEAMIRGCNVIIVSMEYSIISTDWSKFSLFLEYDDHSHSPWKDISSKYQIWHIALHAERPEFPDDQHVINGSEAPRNAIMVIASSKITCHPYLTQLLETRYNIMVVGDQSPYKWNLQQLEPIIGKFNSTVTPDLTISLTACMIVEDCALFCNEDAEDIINKTVIRARELQCKFTKCYVVIGHLSHAKFRVPINGCFKENMGKLSSSVTMWMKNVSGYEVSVLNNALDIEQFGDLIYRLVSRTPQDKSSIRDKLSKEFSRDEWFLSQFPSINILVSRKLLESYPLNEIPNKSLLELTECVLQVPVHFVEDFYRRIHSNDPSSQESQ